MDLSAVAGLPRLLLPAVSAVPDSPDVSAGADLASIAWNLVIIAALVLINGFFVAAEFAMVKVRDSRIDTWAGEGRRGAKSAAYILDHVDEYLSACQLGITLASLGLGWAGEPFIASWLVPALDAVGIGGPWSGHVIAATIAFLFITYLHIVVGEMAPKSLAIRTAETIVLWVAGPLRLFNAVFYPFIWLLNGSANLLLRPFGIKPAGAADEAHTQDDLRVILAQSARHGHLSRRERLLMEKILDFPEKVARQIMQPRTAMVVLRLEKPLAENLRIAAESGHSRFPVCRGEGDDVVGFVLIRDLYAAQVRGDRDVRKVMRKALFLPENCPLERLLTEFQRGRVHLAIIIDEYGATAGLVTLEDVLEEIVGEIQDESDTEQPPIRQVTDGVYLVDGMFPLRDFEAKLGLDFSEFENDADTVAGLVLGLTGRAPRVGQEAFSQGHRFRIEAVEGRRISRVRFVRHDQSSSDGAPANGGGPAGPDSVLNIPPVEPPPPAEPAPAEPVSPGIAVTAASPSTLEQAG